MIIQLSPNVKNATPAVVEAIDRLKASGGGELRLEKGEYHFFKDGAKKEFFAVSNNSACDKYIAFPLLDAENITVDGQGSTLVFHDVLFPFMVSHAKNIILRNMLIDTGKSPLVKFYIHGATDEGFYMDIDADAPFFIENGSLCFKRESKIVSGKREFFSLHAIGRHRVQYFATGDCEADMDNLPAPLMKCDVSYAQGGIYARYRADSPAPSRFSDEAVTAIVDGKRTVDVICLDLSENVEISGVTVARGIGMGIIGQLSHNILIDGFSTDIGYHAGAHQTLTADAMHFVNCSGKLEIKNCAISDTMDDVINVHGVYTVLTALNECGLCAALKHKEQFYFNPYRAGDRLEIIDGSTLEVVAEFKVDSARFEEGSGVNLIIDGNFTYGAESVREGFLIENPDKMPDLYMHHNRFERFPHIRISGGGRMLVEENYFADCSSALLCMDLAKFWYESGRVNELVYRGNTLDNCNKGSAFVSIGIDGVSPEGAPKIHRRIEISGNRFTRIEKCAVEAWGVEELVLENNSFDTGRQDIFKI